MYNLFIEISGVPEEVFAASDVLQKWFSVCAFGLTFVGVVAFWWAFVTIFRIFMGGSRRG